MNLKESFCILSENDGCRVKNDFFLSLMLKNVDIDTGLK